METKDEMDGLPKSKKKSTQSKKPVVKEPVDQAPLAEEPIAEKKPIGVLIAERAIADEGMRELKGNSGWEEKEFEAEMKLTGWQPGQAWCSFFAEKIWTNVYDKVNPEISKVVSKLFSANAVQTWEFFQKSNFPTISKGIPSEQLPQPGDVVIWMLMNGGQPNKVKGTAWIKGHVGIVIDANKKNFTTLEGNSNASGGREGIEVAKQIRSYNFENTHGLKLLGFIRPIE